MLSIERIAERIAAEEKRIRFLCRSPRAVRRCSDRLAMLVLALDCIEAGEEEAAREFLELAN